MFFCKVILFQLICILYAFNLNKRKQLVLNETFKTEFKYHLNQILQIDPNYFDYKPLEYKFNCSINKSNSKAKTVHQLTPFDIQVVAGLGDSITTATGAKARTPLGLLVENRELSWSIGGISNLNNYLTLPNILKKFNPNLIGYSRSSSFIFSKQDRNDLNLAQAGQEARHLISQVKEMIFKMKYELDEIDYENDWKLVTILIGGNDICDYCKNEFIHSPEKYLNDLKLSLDLMHKEMPKTFVNLVNILNVSESNQLNSHKLCNLLHRSECPCAAFPDSKQKVNDLFHKYSNLSEELAISGRYDTRNDFTVVYQPFLREFKLPRLPNGDVDLSYFAPDCFHFSIKSHGK